jgi:FkbM family methyltransferase
VRQKDLQVGIVSYAQNFEDVMLWRALGHIEAGFWIDVGAAEPDKFSVTRAFSERGWRGINLEPLPAHFAALCAARPRDINLNLAVGAAPGQATFYRIGTTGLSTFDAGLAAVHARNGWPVESTKVEVVTLAEVCRRHVSGAVHFLKIDVEGAERDVLLGADFTACRPWIVLLEATRPDTLEPCHGEWEPILLAAGYRFVWFDGLNRFYIAEEHVEELTPHFVLPPNVFDGFSFPRAEDAAAPRVEPSAAEVEVVAPDGRLRSWRRRIGLGSWKLLRPVVRPVLWRLRSFFVAPLVHEIQSLRAGQAETLRALTDLLPAEAPAVCTDPGRSAGPVWRPAGGGAVRCVHQFHSGAAVGDAITNAMLLLRGELRREGYASDIFARDIDPALAEEVLPLTALPQHADYVLIVQHSIGHDAFERVAALPAPKLLHYHNITPPELLADDPGLAAAAREGRRQLALWRGRVVAATAVSAFNALELRSLGYDVVLECPLLFDVERLRARAAAAAAPRDPGRPFTILFVGRLVESKAQAELIDAFAAFRADFGASCRLVLIGRGDPAAMARLRARAEQHRLGQAVEMRGLVSDDALDRAYATADLYVSLSRHEGFGVPLVEAMAHGVPVLAWPAAAVPYTVGEAGVLLGARDPATVAAAMLALARDPARRAALAERGRSRLEAFALARVWPRFLAALALAGAAPPPPRELRAELAANLWITVAGHFNGSYSLAAVNRTLVRALEEVLPGRVGMQVCDGGRPVPLNPVAGAAGVSLAAIAARPSPPTGPEVVICQHYPVLRPPRRGDLTVGMQFWEETLLPEAIVGALAEYRAVLAPSAAVAKALIDSGLRVPVRTVGFVPDLEAHAALGAERLAAPRPPPQRLTFLHVSSGVPRKGIDALLAGWARAFRKPDPVRLLIKVAPNVLDGVAGQIAALRAADPGIAPIDLIGADLDDPAMLHLYAEADAVVLPTRGEGFNLPAAEAIAAGLPVIVTGWGGQLDYLDGASARLLAFTLVPSASHLASPHSQWADPDLDDLASALRETATTLRNDPAGSAARAASARDRLLAHMDRKAWARRVCEAALDLLLRPPPAPLRLAWVSPWMQACGVAEHSRLLLDHFVGSPAFVPEGPLVLCDSRPQKLVVSPAAALRSRACWRIEPGSGEVSALCAALAAEAPHAVMIQHHQGHMAWQALAALLRARELAGRIVLVTLHSTLEIETLEPTLRQDVLGALAIADRLIVHSPADVTRMQGLGLLDRTTLLPAGAPEARPSRPVRGLPPEAAPVVGSFGFFLPHKGLQQLLQATALLRDIWPGLRLRLVNSRYPGEASEREIAACHELATRLGLDAAVEWYTDYLPLTEALDLLAGCDLLVLPYAPSLESASGAARVAMASGVPVAVSPVAVFDEQGGAVARLPGNTPEAIAAGVAALLRDPARRGALQEAAVPWLQSVSWRAMARRLQGAIEGLCASRC